MLRTTFLALAASCFGANVSALSIVVPQCVTAQGVVYEDIGEMSGNLRLTIASAENGSGGWLVLAHCPSMTQVVVRHARNDGAALWGVYDTIVDMIASSETYTFNDVAGRFAYGDLSSGVSSIVADGCICAAGN